MLELVISLLKEFEGFSSISYPDPVSGNDPWTIGYGTTKYRDGKSVQRGDIISESCALTYLKDDVNIFLVTLQKTIPNWGKLNKNQQAALLSFAYNLGASFFGEDGFDTMTKMLKSGAFWDAQRIFGLYTNHGTPGLVTRRRKEADLFLKPEGTQTMSTKILDYVAQPDGSTCQSAAIAKVLGTTDVAKVRSDLLSLGEPGDPGVMGRYLTGKVKSYLFRVDASLNELKDALSAGCVVIVHGWFTPSGHVITLVGWELDQKTLGYRFLVDDPWFEFDFKSAQFDYSKSGNNVRYSSYGIFAYCVASQSYDDAQAIYKQGRLLSSERNAWAHIIRN